MRVVGGVLLSLGVFMGAGFVFLRVVAAELADGMCEEWVSARIASIDGRRTAVVRHVDCGATTSVSSIIDIQPGGQVFVADGAIDSRGKYGVDVSWRDDQTLEVAYQRARWTEVSEDTDLTILETPTPPVEEKALPFKEKVRRVRLVNPFPKASR